MTHLDQLITVYDSVPNLGITCPSAYADDAQDFFRQHGLFLGEGNHTTLPAVNASTGNRLSSRAP
jgi:hypothetical protein